THIRERDVDLAVRCVHRRRRPEVGQVGEERLMEDEGGRPGVATVGRAGDVDVVEGAARPFLHAGLAGCERLVDDTGVVWVGNDRPDRVVEGRVPGRLALAENGTGDTGPAPPVVGGALDRDLRAAARVVPGDIRGRSAGGEPGTVGTRGVEDC